LTPHTIFMLIFTIGLYKYYAFYWMVLNIIMF
jgi:hypothetical protein